MAYKITEDCISCGACEAECQNGAISEEESAYVIDPDRCTECVGNASEPQCAEICPVEAPVPDPGPPGKQRATAGKMAPPAPR